MERRRKRLEQAERELIAADMRAMDREVREMRRWRAEQDRRKDFDTVRRVLKRTHGQGYVPIVRGL